MSLFTLDVGEATDFETRRELIIRCDDAAKLREALATPGLHRVIEQMLRRKIRRIERARRAAEPTAKAGRR